MAGTGELDAYTLLKHGSVSLGLVRHIVDSFEETYGMLCNARPDQATALRVQTFVESVRACMPYLRRVYHALSMVRGNAEELVPLVGGGVRERPDVERLLVAEYWSLREQHTSCMSALKDSIEAMRSAVFAFDVMYFLYVATTPGDEATLSAGRFFNRLPIKEKVINSAAMALERSAQGLTPTNSALLRKQEVANHIAPRQTSILEDFLEIKIKEELEYGSGETEGVRVKKEVDEDLTSLTWLQNNNLLKTLTLPETGKGKVKQEESPTSDLTAEETASDSSSGHSLSSRHRRSPVQLMERLPRESPGAGSGGMLVDPAEPRRLEPNKHYSKEKHHYSVPYDPQLHITSKPPYSFSCLIFMAIEDSHARALPVKDIYSWITEHFPYFIKAPTGWKNSVRHNLSLNKCFRKVDKAPNLGKGSLWIVDPQYRANLLNALSKAPYHPCASLDRPHKPPILPPTTLTPQQQEFIAMKSQNRLPNPELFPYLSRRLAASEADRMNEADDSDEDSLDDVDAATAMLELKHGQTAAVGNGRRFHRNKWENLIPLISTSPSEDHTYSVEQTSLKRLSVSPDEAYVGGSDSNDDNSRPFAPRKSTILGRNEHDDDDDSWSSDDAEQRNVASALLHLAGGSRKRPAEAYSPVQSKRTHRAKKSHHRPSILQRSKKTPGGGGGKQGLALNNNIDKHSRGSGSKVARPLAEDRYQHQYSLAR